MSFESMPLDRLRLELGAVEGEPIAWLPVDLRSGQDLRVAIPAEPEGDSVGAAAEKGESPVEETAESVAGSEEEPVCPPLATAEAGASEESDERSAPDGPQAGSGSSALRSGNGSTSGGAEQVTPGLGSASGDGAPEANEPPRGGGSAP